MKRMMTRKQIEKWIADVEKERKRVDEMMRTKGPMQAWARRQHDFCQAHVQILGDVLSGKRTFLR